MTQTTNGMAFVAAKVFISPDGTTWTDVSGHGASVAIDGGEREVGEQHTMDGDTPIIKGGKRAAIEVTVEYVYTEEAAEPFEVLRAIHETAGGAAYLQYSPKGGFWFTTGAGVLQMPGYPGGEAESGDILLGEFVISCASLTKAAASS
jgi:hypothetical protein